MSSTWRLIIRCDENATDQCAGLLELPGDAPYDAPAKLGWLRGFRQTGLNTYDACPACRPAVEARLAKAEKEKSSA
jgi:hypothetical protein